MIRRLSTHIEKRRLGVGAKRCNIATGGWRITRSTMRGLTGFGMPRISEPFLNCVFFLYPTEDAATAGQDGGGTGFFVGIRSTRVPGFYSIFAVTNKHVSAGNSWIRINKRSGGFDCIEITDWHISGVDDLAIAPVAVNFQTHAASFIDDDMFATSAAANDGRIVPGDDVFMIGRFVHLDNAEANNPSVRFGNLSMRETRVPHQLYGAQDSLIVEMRSVCGYSGSPCFLTPAQLDLRTMSVNLNGTLLFIGIHWGHILEHAEVMEKIVKTQASSLRGGEKLIQYTNANTGMNGIVPAWRLRPLFEHFRPLMDDNDSEALRARGASTSETQIDAGQNN